MDANKSAISKDNMDSSEEISGVKFNLAKLKKGLVGLNTKIIENLPPNLKEKVPPNAPILQGTCVNYHVCD